MQHISESKGNIHLMFFGKLVLLIDFIIVKIVTSPFLLNSFRPGLFLRKDSNSHWLSVLVIWFMLSNKMWVEAIVSHLRRSFNSQRSILPSLFLLCWHVTDKAWYLKAWNKKRHSRTLANLRSCKPLRVEIVYYCILNYYKLTDRDMHLGQKEKKVKSLLCTVNCLQSGWGV